MNVFQDSNKILVKHGAQALRATIDDPLPEFIFDGDAEITAPVYLIKGLLPPDGVAFLGCQSGAGKTFVATNLTVCLASGEPFFGRAVKERVGVVIVAAEGQGAIAARVEVARRHITKESAPPIAWLARIPPLQSDFDVDAFASRLAAAGRHFKTTFGVRLGVVIIDTVAATFDLEDEDDNSEAARTIRKMRLLGEKINALVIPIHHYGKATTTGLRGASGWRAGADVVLSLLAERNETTGEVSNRQLAIAKSRDGIEGPIAPFDLKFTALGLDDDGEPFGSCVVEPQLDKMLLPQANGSKIVREPRTLRVFREAFTEAIDGLGQPIRVHGDGPEVRAVRIDHLRAQFDRRYATGETDTAKRDDATRKAFRRTLERVAAQFPTSVQSGEEWIWKAD
jgi:hypothetical protein